MQNLAQVSWWPNASFSNHLLITVVKLVEICWIWPLLWMIDSVMRTFGGERLTLSQSVDSCAWEMYCTGPLALQSANFIVGWQFYRRCKNINMLLFSNNNWNWRITFRKAVAVDVLRWSAASLPFADNSVDVFITDMVFIYYRSVFVAGWFTTLLSEYWYCIGSIIGVFSVLNGFKSACFGLYKMYSALTKGHGNRKHYLQTV